MRNGNKKKYNISNSVMHLILISFCILCILPMILTISVSLMSEQEIAKYGYLLIPKSISFDAYKIIFKIPEDVLNAYFVSGFVTIAGTILSLLITAAIGYPLSRTDFKYGRYISFFVFFTMLFGGGMVPSYILATQYLHLKDSLWSLILPGLVPPMMVFLSRIYFNEIPVSLIEAAKIDGVSEISIFFKIIIPLSKPGLTAIGLFIALAYWNDAFQALLYIESREKVPLQLLLLRAWDNTQGLKMKALNQQSFGLLNSVKLDNLSTDALLYAMNIVATVPMLIVFAYFQKFFVKGLVMGAVKN